MTRKEFMNYLLLSVTGLAATMAAACASAPEPDANTEPSPEWPPAD